MHLCVLRGSQNKQRFLFSLYSNNLSVFITEAESVYWEVRTGPLNQIALVSSLKGKTLLRFSKLFYEPHHNDLFRCIVCRPLTYRRNISNDINL